MSPPSGRSTPPAGRVDRTRFRPVTVTAIGLSLGAMAVLLWLLAQHPSGQRLRFPRAELPATWNVLLVSLDTTRPDYLSGCSGGPVATPGLDRVAHGGVVFTSAIAPAPITLPSHASLFTAQNPYRHGVRENTEHALPRGAATLASTLREEGYRTAAFVSAFVMDRRFGLDQGFDEYVDRLDGPEPSLAPGNIELPGMMTALRASRWIHEHAGRRAVGGEYRPFFLFVHFFDAHVPYNPPPPYRDRYPTDPYAGELASQDAALGTLLDALDSSSESARTLVWVVSDHGESLGQHGESTHSLFIYDATLRVVSVLHPPSGEGRLDGAGPPHIVSAETGLVDVAPTVLDLIGSETSLPAADGRSLVPLLDGQLMPARSLYCETHSPLISYGWAPLEGVRSNGWKLIRAPEPELYHLETDPQETHNRYPEEPEVRARLGQELDAFKAGKTATEATRTPTAEEAERLRSLGYIGRTSGQTSTDGSGELARPDPKKMLHFFHETFQQAKTLLLQGRYPEAIAAFNDAARADPGNYSIRLFLAACYRQNGEPEKAEAEYRAAARLSPASPRLWYGWGRAKLAAGDADSAGWAFRRSIELLPTSPDGWLGLGEAEFAAGRPRPAASAFDSALARGGDPRFAHGWLARIYRDGLRDPSRAREHLQRYATLLGITPEEAGRTLPDAGTETIDH